MSEEEKLDILALNSEMQDRGEILDRLSEAGKKAGAAIRQVAEKYIGKEMMDKIAGKDNDEDKDEEKNKKKGGACSGGANQSESSSDSPGSCDGTSP